MLRASVLHVLSIELRSSQAGNLSPLTSQKLTCTVQACLLPPQALLSS